MQQNWLLASLISKDEVVGGEDYEREIFQYGVNGTAK
jgi:hypothetical protein